MNSERPINDESTYTTMSKAETYNEVSPESLFKLSRADKRADDLTGSFGAVLSFCVVTDTSAASTTVAVLRVAGRVGKLDALDKVRRV